MGLSKNLYASKWWVVWTIIVNLHRKRADLDYGVNKRLDKICHLASDLSPTATVYSSLSNTSPWYSDVFRADGFKEEDQIKADVEE